MKVFLDTNIVIDLLDRREPFYVDAVKLFTILFGINRKCRCNCNKKQEGFCSFQDSCFIAWRIIGTTINVKTSPFLYLHQEWGILLFIPQGIRRKHLGGTTDRNVRSQ